MAWSAICVQDMLESEYAHGLSLKQLDEIGEALGEINPNTIRLNMLKL